MKNKNGLLVYITPFRNWKECSFCVSCNTMASFFSECTGGGRKERRRRRPEKLIDYPIMTSRCKRHQFITHTLHPSSFVILLLLLLAKISLTSSTNGDLSYHNKLSSFASSPISVPLPVPEDCTPTTTESGLALKCTLSAINSAEEKTNFSVIPSQHTTKLTVICQQSQIISNLEADGFRSLQHLRHLVIHQCNFQSIPPRSFWGLKDLESLSIKTPKISHLNRIEDRDKSAINKNENGWKNGFLRIHVDAFYGVDKLTTLDLSENQIQEFPVNTLCPLNNLKFLNLSRNNLNSFDDIVVTDGCLGSVQILDVSNNQISGILSFKTLQAWTSVSSLFINGNKIQQIAGDALDMLKVTLQKLDASDNHITRLPKDVFRQAHYVKWINLSRNLLTDLSKNFFKHQRESLIHLDLSHNSLTLLDKNLFANLSKLSFLDLSQNKLETLHPKAFEGLKQLKDLNLGHNQITNIHPVIFSHLINLQSLILSGNRLRSIEPNTFSNLASLSHLLLDLNQLNHPLDQKIFAKMKSSLKVLDLSHNQLESINEALKSLNGGSLQSLSISHNHKLSKPSDSLEDVKLSHLWRLQISNNSMTNVTLISFHHFPALQVLDLSNNKISRIEMGTFHGNKALQAIRLDGNNLDQMQGLFQDLPNLSWLNISDNRISMFDYAMLPSSKSLKWLDIHKNAITGLENYFSTTAVGSDRNDRENENELSYIDASFNKIRELGPQNVPNSVESLILNDNIIATIVPYTFFKKTRLKQVDLTLNKMETIDRNAIRLSSSSDLLLSTSPSINKTPPSFLLGGNPIQCDCHMAWFKSINSGNSNNVQSYPIISDLEAMYCKLLHSKDNSEVIPLVEANADDFLCPYETHCFALCHCCDYDACDCEMTCPKNCTCYHDNPWTKNIVDCSGSDFQDLPDQLPMDSTEIYLDGNDINELRSHNFIGRKNLKTLYLNNSNILKVENHTFNGLSILEELHLEDNRLKVLQGDEFHGLKSLKKLFLNNNLLQTINNSTFNGLESLEILFLHGNRLVDYPVWTLSTEDVSKRLTRISLIGNLWSCRCTFMRKFQRWLIRIKNIQLIEDINSLYCSENIYQDHNMVYDNSISSASSSASTFKGERRLIMKRNVTECEIAEYGTSEIQMLDKGYGKTSTLSYLPLLISALIFFVLLIIGVVTIYLYRNEARVWLYSRYGIRFFQRIDAVADAEKIFDAFLAYSVADDVFVRQVLAPELEHGGNFISYPNQYKLCLFYRDLPLQVCLAELIIQASESSKRTIIILSENFLKSEWSRYDFKSGLHQALRATQRKPIIIMLGDIPSREIDPDLRLYLKNGTILYWGTKSFWEKLKYLMPDIRKGIGGHHVMDDTYSFRYETCPRRAYEDTTSPTEEDSTRTMTLHI